MSTFCCPNLVSFVFRCLIGYHPENTVSHFITNVFISYVTRTVTSTKRTMWNDLPFHITSAQSLAVFTLSAYRDSPLLSFILGHPDMTYLSLLIMIVVFPFFLAFPVDLAIIDIIYATLNMSMMMMMMMMMIMMMINATNRVIFLRMGLLFCLA